MARVYPFRGWRYNPQRVPDVSQALAPLLEAHDSPTLAAHYARPESALHLAHPRSGAQARAQWQAWLALQLVQRDPLPAVYPYAQRFSLYGTTTTYERRGLLALVDLQPPADYPHAGILTHEEVLSESVAQRIQSLDELGLACAPTHGYVADENKQLHDLLEPWLAQPLACWTDAQGVQHRLGMLQHAGLLHQLQQHLLPQPVVLADGHHRLAAAQGVYARRSQRGGNPQWARRHLMFLTLMGTEAPRIQPFHRVVQVPEGYAAQELLTRLNDFCVFHPLDARTPLYQELQQHPGSFGLLYGRWRLRCTFKPGLDMGPVPSHLTPAVRCLLPTQVHSYVLDHILGIPYATQPQEPRISYVKDLSRAQEASLQPGHVVVLLPGVTYEELLAVSQEGGRMPPKTTYFYPKIPAGLVFASLDDDDYPTALDAGF